MPANTTSQDPEVGLTSCCGLNREQDGVDRTTASTRQTHNQNRAGLITCKGKTIGPNKTTGMMYLSCMKRVEGPKSEMSDFDQR